jgi:dihydroxyacetone kinase-like protein
MKKFINGPENVVRDMLEGIERVHREIRISYDPAFVYRADVPVKKVSLISGGGSGHEPLHCGYVGTGMLDAACPGYVFTSPTPQQISEACKKVYGGRGALFVVKNYSGDVMNFAIARDLLSDEGYEIESTLVADDISIKEKENRRGVGGTVFIEKIAGAAAEKGFELGEVKRIADKTADNCASIGIALQPCVLPQTGKANFELGEDEMEFGIGIHGELGKERREIESADRLAVLMMEAIESEISVGDRMALLINGMGGTPLMELYVLARKTLDILRERSEISRVLVGNYITSLDMQGASITCLTLDEELEELLNVPVDTPALRW